MPNPILPLWEYIPDGEPRVFGDRVYLYGSHDRFACQDFCDFKLKVWSAPVDDLNNWQCHGVSFRTRDGAEHKSDTSEWTDRELYAPDCVTNHGKYYLYTYIVGSKGCVSVSDDPEGPFTLLSRYEYDDADAGDDGIYNDAGVLVDDDGKVYVYYGFTESHMNELDGESMYKVVKGSHKRPVIDDSEDVPEEQRFFEASSPRKIGDKYYLIYSPRKGSRLAYATSDSPKGPFTYRGYIIDNGVDYPGGNDHGSVCNINGQWYIFYHRMTNNTIMSRRACAEKIEIMPDGSIPPVEMTSLGFEESLDPYKAHPAEIACVLTGGCFITERDAFTRPVINITSGAVMGYKYFDFGKDSSDDTMLVCLKIRGQGTVCKVDVIADDKDNGEVLGTADIGTSDGVYKARIKKLTGRHAVYFRAYHTVEGWTKPYFDTKPLFEFEEFVFMK
ncbi:MAG: family 43 glycosylhydrolase [Ruminococcus sp.]|nr:family 43 glycosylhydrolase [Ruminococcus sp.]